MIRRFLVSLVVVAVPIAGVPRAAAPSFDAAQGAPSVSRGAMPVMLLDGESGGPYHDWQHVTPVLKKILDETGLFDDHRGDGAAGRCRRSRRSRRSWQRYKAVVMNYDAPDERWPSPLKASFEQYVRGGGGFVPVHAADNAFPGWAAFNEMIGVGGWRGRTAQSGPYWFVKMGNSRRIHRRAGRQSRPTRSLPARCARADHPIMRGLPPLWMHQGDELYARLRGPGRNMTVLASAYSDPANAGSGRDEPMLLALTFGKGRVFHTTLGHDIDALSSVDFVVTLQRGTEWAATGEVTQKVPTSFPTAGTVSYRADLAAMDAAYRLGLDALTASRR